MEWIQDLRLTDKDPFAVDELRASQKLSPTACTAGCLSFSLSLCLSVSHTHRFKFLRQRIGVTATQELTCLPILRGGGFAPPLTRIHNPTLTRVTG